MLKQTVYSVLGVQVSIIVPFDERFVYKYMDFIG